MKSLTEFLLIGNLIGIIFSLASWSCILLFSVVQLFFDGGLEARSIFVWGSLISLLTVFVLFCQRKYIRHQKQIYNYALNDSPVAAVKDPSNRELLEKSWFPILLTAGNVTLLAPAVFFIIQSIYQRITEPESLSAFGLGFSWMELMDFLFLALMVANIIYNTRCIKQNKSQKHPTAFPS